MKKIKKKARGSKIRPPAYAIGYRGTAPPPGFLGAWFDREYGGPLTIEFPRDPHALGFEARHTTWSAYVQVEDSEDRIQWWKDQVGWDHPNVIWVNPLAGSDHDFQNRVLHVSRVARGLVLLTEGTSFDVTTGSYRNPSDWHDQPLSQFYVEDHIRIQHIDQDERIWFSTRGLKKFGWEEFEIFQPRGLPEQPMSDLLLELCEELIQLNKGLRIGESLVLPFSGRTVRVTRHRTEQGNLAPFSFREITVE